MEKVFSDFCNRNPPSRSVRVKHPMPNPTDHQPTEPFIRALTEAQSALRGYCHASLGLGDEAKEAVQRANITLWRKCGDWDPSTDFLPWAIAVAKFEVLGVLRDRQRREARFVFDPDVVELMADESARVTGTGSYRAEALEHCLGKLSESNRAALTSHYVHGHSIGEMADSFGKRAGALKVMLLRLRGKLRECIEDRLAKGGAA
jgi:RNA polymerase sigma-70 factor, ECF subfamily